MTQGPHEVEFPSVDKQLDMFTRRSYYKQDVDKLHPGVKRMSTIEYRYTEDKFLEEVQDYVAGTYKGHYVGGGEYQTVDIWNTLGSAATTCRDTAIKYLMRYGKKDGYNKKDLLKAVHYITLLNHYTQEIDNDETSR